MAVIDLPKTVKIDFTKNQSGSNIANCGFSKAIFTKEFPN